MKLVNSGYCLDADPVPSSRSLRAVQREHLAAIRPKPSLLSAAQTEETLAYWRRFTPLEDAGWADFYLSRTGRFDPRYVPHDLFYAEIDRVLNPPYRAFGLDDKLLYERLFPGIRQPRRLVAKSGGVLWVDGEPVDEARALQICAEAGEVICKKPILSCGGHGVWVLDARTQRDILASLLRRSDEVLVQTRIRQHPDLAAFHPTSVNTLRLMTYLRQTGEVVCLSATLRMGAGENCVDNVSSGGCSCGVRMDGTLRKLGCSWDNRLIEAHPEGRTFAGRCVPSFEAALNQVLHLHRTLPQFALLAWDIAIDTEDEPVLIELNAGNASIDFVQINNGPLFGSYTEEVLERIYRRLLY